MANVKVENKSDKEVVVVLEPWAAEFSLAAKDYLMMESKQDYAHGKFLVEYDEGYITVWPEGFKDAPRVINSSGDELNW